MEYTSEQFNAYRDWMQSAFTTGTVTAPPDCFRVTDPFVTPGWTSLTLPTGQTAYVYRWLKGDGGVRVRIADGAGRMTLDTHSKLVGTRKPLELSLRPPPPPVKTKQTIENTSP